MGNIVNIFSQNESCVRAYNSISARILKWEFQLKTAGHPLESKREIVLGNVDNIIY